MLYIDDMQISVVVYMDDVHDYMEIEGRVTPGAVTEDTLIPFGYKF